MVAEPETIARTLGQLEGRITELSASVQEVNRRMDAGFQEVNRRIDRMLLAMLAIGGGLIITQTGLLATLLIRGG